MTPSLSAVVFLCHEASLSPHLQRFSSMDEVQGYGELISQQDWLKSEEEVEATRYGFLGHRIRKETDGEGPDA